jgi:hypothetical protein
MLPSVRAANTAWVDPNDHTKLLPESEGGVKITEGGAQAKGEPDIPSPCDVR